MASSNPLPFLDFTQQEAPPLQIITIPASEYVLKGVQNTLHVLFQIKTGNKYLDHVERPPCDLAIVLDRSGSMAGDKLENSKAAIKNVIQNLTQSDRLHLIVYDTNVDVIFENGDLSNPDILQRHVDRIEPLNSTNLYAGLAKGAEVLKQHRVTGESRVQRVFLFSDGLVNHGKKSPEEIKTLVRDIRADGISISSFGIGSDFDEELMKTISEWGSGDYFFIENAQFIPQYVAKGLRGLLALIGTDPVLKIRGANGAILKKIFAHEDGVIKGVHLGDLKQNNLRQIVCEIETSPTDGDGNDLVTWSLTYIPDGQKALTELKGKIHIKFTDDDALVLNKHPAVEVAKTMQEIGDSDLEVLLLLDTGRKKEAIEIKKKDLTKLQALEPLDPSGTIKILAEKTKKSLCDLQDDSVDMKEVRKEVHYNGYLQRRNSAYAIF